MANFTITVDSAADLPLDFVTKNNIHVLPMAFHVGKDTFFQYPDNREISLENFYSRLKNKENAKTSQVNPEDYVNIIEPLLKNGQDVITISISSGLSGSFNALTIGKEMLLEKYPDRKILLVDSLAASMAEGWLVQSAVELKNKGKSIEEVYAALIEEIPHVTALFTVDSLDSLRRGGRISPTKAFLATLLNFKPVLNITDEGKLQAWGKERGRKKSLQTLVTQTASMVLDASRFVILQAVCLEDANLLKDLLIEKFPKAKVEIIDLGPVIGSHTGPGGIAIIFKTKQRAI